jgi:hypothetical protein
MTPPPGNIRVDGRGGLRVVIEGIEHLATADDVALHLVCQAVVAQRLKDRKQQKVIDA